MELSLCGMPLDVTCGVSTRQNEAYVLPLTVCLTFDAFFFFFFAYMATRPHKKAVDKKGRGNRTCEHRNKVVEPVSTGTSNQGKGNFWIF